MPAPSIHAFAEKVVLISDGAGPVGRAVALQLALQGSYVIVGFSKSNEETERALTELKSLGTLASAVETDVSTIDGAEKLVTEVEMTFGRIDLLINCAGLNAESSFERTTGELYEKSFDANMKSAFFVTQKSLRLMQLRPKPKIVNVVSALDTKETAQNVLYVSTQKALVGFTESLAQSLPKKFRVNAVAVSEKQSVNEALDAELFRPQKGISADDVARTILFLLSAEAIGLNGQVLKVE